MMTETIQRGRRSGWSDAEDKLLWETADEAQQQGLPLKAVFERIAQMTGRRPNSIRNYYYAQSREREGAQEHKARFVPFQEDEVEQLLAAPKADPRRPTFLVRDVRLFLNTLNRSLDLMKQGGVQADMQKRETEDALILTISIPKNASAQT